MHGRLSEVTPVSVGSDRIDFDHVTMAMRTLTYLGLGVLVCGALVFVASSGAFDSTSADRGVGIETAPDRDALLGIEDPSDRFEDDVVALRASEADRTECYFIVGCYNYYFDEELMLFTDGLPDGELAVRELTVETTDDGIVYENGLQGGDGIRHESSSDGLRVVLGDFYCSDPHDGDGATVTVSVTAESVDESVRIDLERTVRVECVPDA